jgi:hypothetical protein
MLLQVPHTWTTPSATALLHVDSTQGSPSGAQQADDGMPQIAKGWPTGSAADIKQKQDG